MGRLRGGVAAAENFRAGSWREPRASKMGQLVIFVRDLESPVIVVAPERFLDNET